MMDNCQKPVALLAHDEHIQLRMMQSIADVKIDAPIILHPDSEVPLGYVIEAYDVSKQVGFQKVSFAVNPTQP